MAPLGSPYLTAAYEPKVEAAALHTAVGQADFCDPQSPHTCADCVHWRASKTKGKGRCAEFVRRTMGRQGALIKSFQRACRAFQADATGGLTGRSSGNP
jgi:hypothetical protein